ncbi:hypothetical protein UY3_03132 [Chelonia mydas]|uniref:Myb/SANT-like DNA-binding domain-containing protein n=1 Tax=Chelonia mydas TaxID=8469 RepID=M7BQZ2_CHEMY|nr:hypothetical protein UY3_03132 [Chelonia mydas]
MAEKGYTRDTQQCHVKIKELRQAFQKAREANSHSGSELQTCCFHKELRAILSSDPTMTPKSSVDTSEELVFRASAGNTEQEVLDKEEEEENERQASGGMRDSLRESQELFVTPEQSSQPQNSIMVEHWGRNL